MLNKTFFKFFIRFVIIIAISLTGAFLVGHYILGDTTTASPPRDTR